ncbi:AUGMIN subunit 4 [Dichanthelium oligosanthes]|uniref:AUGMIN subunit 4 n=1 Tax=Dichanthelium oligosanthes TaxID=888268 RepID=A0A1E5UQW8_9POAL|nr:AUGMIN subunit 4 [Dichanthelium oligosanthes]
MSKAAAAASLPPPPPEVAHLVDQLQRHHLAPDASLLSNSAHSDLLQVYESLEHRLAVAEAAQRLRLPLLSQDGEVHEEEIEKLSTLSRSSFDSTLTSATPSSSSISTSYNNYSSTASAATVGAAHGGGSSEVAEPGVGGVPDRFLGITSDYLYQVQQEQPAMSVDMVDYQRTLAREIEARLEAKCDALADLFAMDERDSSSISQISSARLPERVKLIIEEIEKEEAHLLEDLASMDRKFAEHYNVLEQILAVLIQFVKDKKLEHQHQYDDLKKTWLIKRCRTMHAKLRKYLVEATKEASNSYNEAISRLREYQGVDPHFDVIARQYHEIVKVIWLNFVAVH